MSDVLDDDEGEALVREILSDPTQQQERGEREEWAAQSGWHRKEDVRSDDARAERAKRRRLFAKRAEKTTPPPKRGARFSSSSSSSSSPPPRPGSLPDGGFGDFSAAVGVTVAAVLLSILWWLLRRPKPPRVFSRAEMEEFASLDRSMSFGSDTEGEEDDDAYDCDENDDDDDDDDDDKGDGT